MSVAAADKGAGGILDSNCIKSSQSNTHWGRIERRRRDGVSKKGKIGSFVSESYTHGFPQKIRLVE
jgi:hypothetical protein